MEFYINDAKSESAIKVSLQYVCKIYLHGYKEQSTLFLWAIYICEYDAWFTILDLVFSDNSRNFYFLL